MSSWKIAGALLVLSAAITPQDLPPDVLLLARLKAHLRDELSRLPDYTCLETVSRFHKESGPLKPLDTVRLEIVYSGHREWYGSPGDRNLGAGDPAGFVGSGMIGAGAFAAALNNIISGAHFTYRGKETLGNQDDVKYDFQFPRQPNAFEISMVGGAGTVGEEGSAWIDEQSLDLIRLEYHAAEIPPYLPLAAQRTTVNYARTKIGESTALLAQQADMQMTETAGIGNFDHVEFTHCRAFTAESSLRFDETTPQAPVAAAPLAPAQQALPALLKVTVQLTTPISNGDAVGKLIAGRIVGDISYKGKIVIPNGAVVGGRIRRLERYEGLTKKGARESIVGIEFTEVEASGGRTPFYADLLSADPIPGLRATFSETIDAGLVKVTLHELPGVASFFADGPAFTIPAGFRTVWRTRGPIRMK